MNNEYLYEKKCVNFSTVVLLSHNIELYSGALIRGVVFVVRVWLICLVFSSLSCRSAWCGLAFCCRFYVIVLCLLPPTA